MDVISSDEDIKKTLEYKKKYKFIIKVDRVVNKKANSFLMYVSVTK